MFADRSQIGIHRRSSRHGDDLGFDNQPSAGNDGDRNNNEEEMTTIVVHTVSYI